MRPLRYGLVVALIVATPLPFGSVTPFGVAALAAVVAATLLVWLADRESVRALVVARWPLLALLGLAALAVVQAVPLPGGALSVAPDLTAGAASGWALAAALLAIGAMAGGRVPRGLLVGSVAVATLFQALYGWRRLEIGEDRIWGRVVDGPVGRLRGTFVNADHLALMLEIAVAVFVAWAWWAFRRAGREPRLERRLAGTAPPVVALGVAAVALVGTGSRAAVVAMAAALPVAAALVAGRRRWWWAAAAAVGVVASGVLVLGAAIDPQESRQLDTPLYRVLSSPRFLVWRPAIELWRERPWLGSGLGTFSEVFPRVQPEELTEERWDQAHNDPLELLVTGGVAALALLLLAVGTVVRRALVVYRSRRPSSQRAAAVALLVALPAVAIHELFDFGLTIPSNAVWMALLAGAALAPEISAARSSRSPASSAGRW